MHWTLLQVISFVSRYSHCVPLQLNKPSGSPGATLSKMDWAVQHTSRMRAGLIPVSRILHQEFRCHMTHSFLLRRLQLYPRWPTLNGGTAFRPIPVTPCHGHVIMTFVTACHLSFKRLQTPYSADYTSYMYKEHSVAANTETSVRNDYITGRSLITRWEWTKGICRSM
jgi:hypothetical protein